MAATEWAPAWDQYGTNQRVVVAHSITPVLERTLRQRAVPLAVTPMTHWLLDDVGMVWPGSTGRRWPTDNPDC